jgi:hypothetical protein
MGMPPILDADDVTVELIDDIRDASLTYFTKYSYTSAFDNLVTGRASAGKLAKLLDGKCSSESGLRCLRDGLLGKWGSARSLTAANSPGIAKGLGRAASFLRRIPSDAQLVNLTHEQVETLVSASEAIDDCNGIGATIASKIVGALRPAAAVMWDTPIAQAYGFAHSTAGYRRFLRLMTEVAARLRQVSGERDLEALLKPDGRKWKAPLAKVIDEWHWIRITRKHRYRP